jgi:hypothetical protein
MIPNHTLSGNRETNGGINGGIARSPRWVTFVVRAAAFLVLALLFTEGLWRALGYLPKGSDFIFFARLRRAADHDRNAAAMVGSSRIRYGLNPETLARAVPGHRFLQLALDGNSAIPVLHDLAMDERFHGLVICEVNPPHWDGQYDFGNWRPEALAYVYPEVSGAYLESVLDEHVRQHFSFYSHNLFLELPNMLLHRRPTPPERPDRYEPLSYLGPALDRKLIRNWEAVAREAAERIGNNGSWQMPRAPQEWVRRIRQRGGDVAFVRMPVDGDLRVLEDRLFPFLPSLIEDMREHGNVVIDFADMPDHFYCPDGSHLEARDADRFSWMLGKALAAKNFFR